MLRVLFYQISPFAQDKKVPAKAGSVFDLAVDIRKKTENYGS
ncbi:dTDP-4-dehydrorhamnose 3,5-epimerase family protein [Alishewanella tabrizica]